MGRKAYTARALIRPTAILPPKGPTAPISEASANPNTEWLTKEEMADRLNLKVRAFGDLVRDHRNLPRRVYSQKTVRFNPVKVEAFLDKFNVEVAK